MLSLGTQAWGIPIPFENGTIVVYLVGGERLALIDTGVATVSLPVIAKSLSALSLSLNDIDLVINTHGHPDHAGGNADIRSAAGSLQILAHSNDAALTRGPAEHLRHECDPAFTLAELGDWATLSERASFLQRAIGLDPGPDRLVTDGEAIDLGDTHLRVVHTPGHTAGSICIYSPEFDLLFAGDAIQRCGTGSQSPPLYSEYQSYRASLQRVREELAPTTLCLSHAYVDSSGVGDFVVSPEESVRALDEAIGQADYIDRIVREVLPVEDDGTEGSELRLATEGACSTLNITPNSHEGFARVAISVRAHLGRS